MFKKVKYIHFIGIGGIGMSGIAEVLLSMGYKVSGSDVNSSSSVEKLQRLGAEIFLGHKASNVEVNDAKHYFFEFVCASHYVNKKLLNHAGIIPKNHV